MSNQQMSTFTDSFIQWKHSLRWYILSFIVAKNISTKIEAIHNFTKWDRNMT